MKALLRKKIKKQRQLLPFQKKAAWSAKIMTNLLSLKAVKKAKSFFVYVDTDKEVATHDLIKKLMAAGKIVTVPKIIHQEEMRPVRLTDWVQLKPGRFGILEPISQKAFLGKIEVVVAPCVALTSQCRRLGRGLGYYDRFLKNHPESLVIALAYHFQVVKQIPMKKTDQLVDIIVTEKGIVRRA